MLHRKNKTFSKRTIQGLFELLGKLLFSTDLMFNTSTGIYDLFVPQSDSFKQWSLTNGFWWIRSRIYCEVNNSEVGRYKIKYN